MPFGLIGDVTACMAVSDFNLHGLPTVGRSHISQPHCLAVLNLWHFVCLFVCAEFFSAVFDPISIKLGHVLYVWV